MGVKAKLNDQQQKEIIIALSQGANKAELARKYNVAYNTIKNIYKKAQEGGTHANVLQQSANIAIESEKRLLDILESSTPYAIVSKIMDIIDNEALLKEEVKKRGLTGVNQLIKTFMELAIKNQRTDNDDNNNIKEKDNFREAMLEAVKSIDNVKSLEAKEAYVQED